MGNAFRTTSAAMSAVALAGCSTVYSDPINSAPLAVAPSAEDDLLATSGRERGLALSGGGIRAGYYSLGAMKALYDGGWLQEVDILSSVSGGGYAAYWLMSAEAAEGDPNTPFGATLFSDRNFPVTVCNAASYSDFVKSWRAPLSVLFGRSVALYDRALKRSFGFEDREGTLAMADLAESVRNGTIPYWIVNVSRYDGDQSSENIFELTPLYAGTRAQGGRWDGWSVGARQAASISGAALKYLRQSIFDPSGDGTQRVALWDGGRTENLGFYSLAVRNPDEMVVVDAEHDPNRKTGALTTVSQYLTAAGYQIDLSAPLHTDEGQAYFATSFSAGSISRGDNGTVPAMSVNYLKMSVPQSLEPLLTNEPMLERGAAVDAEVQAKLDASKVRGLWDCSSLAGMEMDLDAWMIWTVSGYSDFMRNDSYTRHFQRLVPTKLKGDFPQYTTVDTSYYNDQARAFIALGYLNAREMRGTLAQRRAEAISAE
ncbi:MAG: patatin-like phospholipase family protein [Sphingorhabdus sp.]